MKEKVIFFIILMIAIITRVLFLADFPSGFSGDEAQQGYSAYSIFQTGRDEWGEVLPLNPRGFGDFKPPVYTYLTIPSVAILGLNKESVRLPAAILGISTVVLTYFLTKRLFDDKKIALLSMLFLAISPWHIQLSRTAFEAGAGVFFFSLGLYFFLRGINKNTNLVLSSLFLGLTLYTYHSFRLFVLLFIFSLTLFYFRSIPKVKYSLILLIIFFLPVVFNFKASLSRASDVGITSQTEIKGYFERKGVSPLPYSLDRVLDNKVLFVASSALDNYLSYFSPSFFFTGNRSDGSYLNFPRFGLLYPLEITFWLVAIYFIVFRKIRNYKLLIMWFLLAAVPASLAQGAMNAHRVTTFLPLTAIISAIGASKLINLLSSKLSAQKKPIHLLFYGLLTLGFIFFLHFYIVKLSQRPLLSLRADYEPIFRKIMEVEKNYDEVIITKEFTEPQIFVAFYGLMDPVEFQKSSPDWLRYEKHGKLYIDQLESWNLGKYLFEGIDWDKKDQIRPNALIVGQAKDFPSSVFSVYDYKDQKGNIIYRLVPTNQ